MTKIVFFNFSKILKYLGSKISKKNILKKTKLFLTGIVIIQLETMIFSHLTDFSLENTMSLSIYVVFLHFPGIPGNFFGISRISRFPGKNFGPGNRQPY